jgi:hypothetical protein
VNPLRPIPGVVVQAEENLAELARQINEEHRAGEAALRASVQHALRAGELLLAAKKRVGHGSWRDWMAAHVQVAERTAQSYMRLAKKWPTLGEKTQRVADLSLREALKVLAEADQDEPLCVPPDFQYQYGYVGFTEAEVVVLRPTVLIVEFIPSLAHPGFWRFAVISVVRHDEDDEHSEHYWDYNFRGVRLDHLMWKYLRQTYQPFPDEWTARDPSDPFCPWIEEEAAAKEWRHTVLSRRPGERILTAP